MQKKNKNKPKYLFNLFIIIFVFFIISSFTKTNTFIPPKINDTIIVIDSVWENDTLYIYETLHITVNTYDSLKNNLDSTTQEITNTDSNIINNLDNLDTLNLNLPERGFIHPTSISRASYKTPFEKIISYPSYTFGYNLSLLNFSNSNVFIDNNAEYKELYNKSLTEKNALSVGGFVELSRNNYSLETGGYFTRFFEDFKFSESYETVNISTFYNFFEIINWKVDTIYFLNLDSLLLGDTVWMPYFDSTLIVSIDSNLTTNYDTTKYDSNYDTKNLYTYFEIPIIFGYDYKFNSFIFSLKAGIITSFFISTKGFNILYKNKYIVSKNENINFSKVFFSSYLSTKITYKITPSFGFYVEPFYRLPLTQSYYNSLITTRLTAYGVKFGLQYTL